MEKISIIIPVYNDHTALAKALPASILVLDTLPHPFEIIIAEDASCDGGYEISKKFAEADKRIRLNYSETRRGKGGAISDAAKIASGDIICFYDVDLSTGLSVLRPLINAIHRGNDIAIGSRHLPQSSITRTRNRKYAGKLFVHLARVLLGGGVMDYQCGCKAFTRESLNTLMSYAHTRGWTWDTEILALAQRAGYKIAEVPVIWKENDRTTLKWRDTFRMGWEVLTFAWKIRMCGCHPQKNTHLKK